MFRLNPNGWLTTKFSRRRLVVLVLLLLLGTIAAVGGPWLWAWYQLRQGRVELEHSHPQKARHHLNACLRFWPHHVTAHVLAARAARQLEDYQEAEEHLRQAQQQQGRPSEEVLLEWALHRAAVGDLKDTESYLLPRTREDSPEACLACEALAQGYQRIYRIPKALFLLDLWLKQRPNDVRPLQLRGRLRLKLSNWQGAIADYQRVLELEPECEEARRGLALCWTESASWEKAAPYWEELYRQHPEDREVRVNLACCWGHQGQEQQAQQMLQAVLQEHPDYLLALRGLGQILQQEQQPAEAETWLRRAIRAAPKDYQSRYLLHGVLQQQGKTAEAEQQRDQAKHLELRWQRFSEITHRELAARPHDAGLQAEFGVLLLELGYEEAGRNWLRLALREDPHCAAARAALEGIGQSRAATVRKQ